MEMMITPGTASAGVGWHGAWGRTQTHEDGALHAARPCGREVPHAVRQQQPRGRAAHADATHIVERGNRLGGADSGHHILALGVDEVLAVELVLARGGVAAEENARARCSPEVSEDHRLDLGGSEVAPRGWVLRWARHGARETGWEESRSGNEGGDVGREAEATLELEAEGWG